MPSMLQGIEESCHALLQEAEIFIILFSSPGLAWSSDWDGSQASKKGMNVRACCSKYD